jgi:hypothetical protein
MSIHDNDPNRARPSVEATPTANPYVARTTAEPERGMSGYAIPAAIAAVAIVAGIYFMMPGNDGATTAAVDAPVSRQVTPNAQVPSNNTSSPTTPTVTPAPTTTPAPTKIQ